MCDVGVIADGGSVPGWSWRLSVNGTGIRLGLNWS